MGVCPWGLSGGQYASLASFSYSLPFSQSGAEAATPLPPLLLNPNPGSVGSDLMELCPMSSVVKVLL